MPPGPDEEPRGAPFKHSMNPARLSCTGRSGTKFDTSGGNWRTCSVCRFNRNAATVAASSGAKQAAVRHCRARESSPSFAKWSALSARSASIGSRGSPTVRFVFACAASLTASSRSNQFPRINSSARCSRMSFPTDPSDFGLWRSITAVKRKSFHALAVPIVSPRLFAAAISLRPTLKARRSRPRRKSGQA